MDSTDVINTEEFINHAVTKTEIASLTWVLKMLKKYPVKVVEAQIEQYIKELEDDLS